MPHPQPPGLQPSPAAGRPSRARRGFKIVAMCVLVSGVMVWGAAVVAAVGVASQGLLHVKVHEKHAGGDDVSLYFPAAVVNLGFYLAPSFIPEDAYGDATADLARFKPLISGLAREIGRCPDGTLIEVVDHDEKVEIALRGGDLVVHVDSPSEEVLVVMPVSVMRAAAWLLPDAPPAGRGAPAVI